VYASGVRTKGDGVNLLWLARMLGRSKLRLIAAFKRCPYVYESGEIIARHFRICGIVAVTVTESKPRRLPAAPYISEAEAISDWRDLDSITATDPFLVMVRSHDVEDARFTEKLSGEDSC
jgi:hypothetical protein